METILKELPALQQYLASANKILIATGKNPTLDSLAANLSLYLALEKLGKKVTVACPITPTVEFSHLVGLDKLNSDIGSKNFVIVLEDALGSVEKVSHYLEGNNLNLVIHPLSPQVQFTPEKVHFSYSGGNFDLIFIVGTQNIELLDNLYTHEPNLYSNVPVVNLDASLENTYFGKINLVDRTASSVSEIVLFLLRSLNCEIDQDLANNLLLGIKGATQNLQSPKVSAQTLDAAAFCLRAGAKWSEGGEVRKAEEPVIPDFSALIKNPQEEVEVEEEVKPDDSWFSPKIFRSSDISKQ